MQVIPRISQDFVETAHVRKALQGQTAWFQPEFILFCAAHRNFTVTDSVVWLVNPCKYLLIMIATKLQVAHGVCVWVFFFFNPAIKIVTFVTFFLVIQVTLQFAFHSSDMRVRGSQAGPKLGGRGWDEEVQSSTRRAWLWCSAVENV